MELPQLQARTLLVPQFIVEGAPAPTDASFFSRAFSCANDGVVMTIWTVLLTILLELWSLDMVKNICRTSSGKQLYIQGVIMNVVNNCILGPIAYQFVNKRFMSDPFSDVGHQLLMVGAILLGHAIGYYCSHRLMHTRHLYWAHKFHHRFNVFVVPVTANAVSLAEYAIAYMAPFVAGSALLRPDRCSMFVAVGIISFNNLLIHTPALCDLSAKWVPWLGVSTADHLEHHKRLTSFYAAPTISIDRLLMAAFGKPESWNTDFDAAEQVREEKGKGAAAASAKSAANATLAARRSPRRRAAAYPVGE